MAVEFISVERHGLAGTAALLTRGFADYLVKIPFTEALLAHLERLEDVDFSASPVARLGGEPVGAALVGRRGAESRLAGMAIVPPARRQGVGRALMEHLLTAARSRGDRRMVLEVIGQNEAALRLYEDLGFRRRRRLLGFSGTAPAGLQPVEGLAEVAVGQVAAAIARQSGVDWPWQISAETMALLTPPACGYALDGVWTVVSNPGGAVAGFRTLVIEGNEHRDGRAMRLLYAVMARHPTITEWRMSALLPEELGGGFAAAGLKTSELYQWQMEMPMDEST